MASRRNVHRNDLQRPLPQPGERTGRHKCTNCLREVTAEELLRNDFLCDACAQLDEYPSSTKDQD